ncbi:MAG: hypothetical protein AMXMBFR49_30380 [Chlorobiota bacterium]
MIPLARGKATAGNRIDPTHTYCNRGQGWRNTQKVPARNCVLVRGSAYLCCFFIILPFDSA